MPSRGGRERLWVSTSASVRSEDESGSRRKLPFNSEWEAMAKKVLKGADPAEKLTWRTPEVSSPIYSIRQWLEAQIYH